MNSFEPDRNQSELKTGVPLSVSVSPRRDTAEAGTLVRIQGALLVSSAWQVKELELPVRGRVGLVRREPGAVGAVGAVEIDLAGVTELDSAGIAAVVFLARSAQADGFRVHIVEPSHPQARAVATMTGMFDLLNRRPVLAA